MAGSYKMIYGFIFVLLLSIFAGLWNLGKAGQVWDEEALLKLGYKHISHARNLDFTNDFWWKGEHADHPPLVRYVRGFVGQFDIVGFEKNGDPIFDYSILHNRYLSVILYVLTTITIFLFASKYISNFVGLTSSIIFSLLPIPLGHSQLSMYEPFNLFLFTLSTVLFIDFLFKGNSKKMILTGIVTGFAFLAKETNFMLVPMFFGVVFIKGQQSKFKTLKNDFIKTIYIFITAVLVFFVVWPMPFFHLKEFLTFQWGLRGNVSTSIPEVFFGKLMLVPKVYYIAHFIITTPLLVLFLFLVGLKKIDKSKKWILYVLVFWFVFPFILSFYPKREQGIRYIIQICAPLSIIAAIGFDSVISKFGNNLKIRYGSLFILITYLSIVLYRISPYYIDYFNGLVGGAKNVYENRLFHLAWWGEGIKEAFDYLKTTPKGSKIGIATSPSHILPELDGWTVENYKDGEEYDYVVVNFYHIVRIGFDDSDIRRKYKAAYEVMADGAPIVIVYEKK